MCAAGEWRLHKLNRFASVHTAVAPLASVIMHTSSPERDEISDALRNRLHLYRSQRVKVRLTLQQNVTRATVQRAHNRDIVTQEAAFLRAIFTDALLPLFQSAKCHVPDPLAPDSKVACYYLIGKACNNWRTALLLLENGMFYDAMELLRSAVESTALVWYFTSSTKELDAWFVGEVVPPKQVRGTLDRIVNEQLSEGSRSS